MKKLILMIPLFLVACSNTPGGSSPRVAQIETLESITISDTTNSEKPYVYTDKGSFVFYGEHINGSEPDVTASSTKLFNLNIGKQYCVIHYSSGEVADIIEPEKCIDRSVTPDEK